jgi:multidrug efflux pump subunit AcrB
MNTLLDFFIRQKKLALVFSVSIIVVGLLILDGIQRNKFPVVDLEIMVVTTAYPGASPQDVEQNVTNVIEDELKSVTGIDEYTSTSKESSSLILITLEADVDVFSVKQEIREAVNRVRTLPDEVPDLPKVFDAQPTHGTLRVGLSAPNMDYAQLRKVVDEAVKMLEGLEGIAEVSKDGYLDKEIQIRIDVKKLEQYKLSLDQVIGVISARNQRYTVGTNHSFDAEKNIVILAKLNATDSIKNVVLKSTFDGPIIRLKDVATITQANVEQKKIVRINGEAGFILTIFKQDNADVIDSVNRIKEKLSEFNQKYSNALEFSYSADESTRLKNRLEIVIGNGLIGLIMVLIVLSLFLNFKTAFWVALSLPVSLLGTVILLGINGENINIISLAAIILVLGIVVDDSIVVAESIHHYKQQGLSGLEAAKQGFKRVILPIITTITTTILVFSSMFLMGGTMGKFIYVIPLVVIFALILSLLEVSIALPAHLAGSRGVVSKNSWFNGIEHWFANIMQGVIRWRYLVLSVFVLVLSFSLYFAKNNMRTVLFPVAGSNTISATMEMQKGASLQLTQKTSEQVERLIFEVLGENISSVSNNVERTRAKFRIDLISANLRQADAQMLVESLRAQRGTVLGVKSLSFSIKRPGPPQGADIQVRLMGEQNQRTLSANKLYDIMKNINGLNDIYRDDEPGKKRLEVVLDFAKMAQLNVDFSVVNRYLRTAFTGVDITNIRQGEAQVDFRVYFGSHDNSEDFLKQLKINNTQGNLVPLRAFSSIREIQGEPDFNHVNGRRATRISASINDKITDVQKVTKKILSQLNAKQAFPRVEVTIEGGAKDTKKSMQDFVKAFVFSIFGIYLLLLLLFNSYTQPLLVLSAIPFAVIGVIWAFFLHGEPLSFFAALGVLALVGVIVNDSLILVSHLNFLKTQENSKNLTIQQQVVLGTTDRLRAVVLTTLTTLAGIIPLAYGIGGVDALLQPMALALGYGLLFGTLMTLVLLPCLYMVNHEFLEKLTQLKQKIFKKNTSN